MATLADFLNTPREIEVDGTPWLLRQPIIDEEAMFQRWLEDEAHRTIERRAYQIQQQKAEDLQKLQEAIESGAYEYSGKLAIQMMGRPKGVAKMVAIVCRDQGMSPEVSRRMVETRYRDIEAVFSSKMPKLEDTDLLPSADPQSPRSDFLVWLCNSPFNRSILELKQLTWDQVLLLFDVERHEDGSAKIAPPPPGKRLTREGMFRRRCYLLGITDQTVVDRLWKKEKAAMKERERRDRNRAAGIVE